MFNTFCFSSHTARITEYIQDSSCILAELLPCNGTRVYLMESGLGEKCSLELAVPPPNKQHNNVYIFVCRTCCVLSLLCISQRPKELISRKQSRGIKTEAAHAFLSLVTSACRNQMAETYIPLSAKIAPLGVSRAVHVRGVLCSLHLGYQNSW